MGYLLIRNGTLIDGKGGTPLKHAAVLVRDNRIEKIDEEQSLELPETEIPEIDAEGGYILPGFIDCHVHLVLENLTISNLLSTPLSLTLFKALDHMKRCLAAGVTSVRDAGGADLGLKMAVEDGIVSGPRMQISITILGMTGGHLDYAMPSGNEYRLFPSYPGRPDGQCDGVEEVRKKVREVLRAGADIVKICTTGGTMSPSDHPSYTQFSPDELEVVVQEAAFHGNKKVMAHAQGLVGIKNSLRAGVHSIEHGVYLDDEAIDLMLEHEAFLVPTLLAPIYALEQHSDSGELPEWGIRKMKEVLDINLESAAKAYQAGVKIAMGTDTAVSPHGMNLREPSLMCQIGMSPMEAIVASTRVSAECLGWQDELGTVEPGKLADIVVVKKDPLAKIESLGNPEHIGAVIQDGIVVKRQ
jgi:imidazolonepropionase-like amidohydrolase